MQEDTCKYKEGSYYYAQRHLCILTNGKTGEDIKQA